MSFPKELPDLYVMFDQTSAEPEERIEEALRKARLGEGLELIEAARLLTAGDQWSEEIFAAARHVNWSTKGRQITFYGVVYIHDYCVNICSYCGDSMHADHWTRKLLTREEFATDVRALLAKHPLKEICFLMGEDHLRFKFDQLVDYLKALAEFYDEKIILNIPPLGVRRFEELRAAIPRKNRIHFRVFQESYDRDTYRREHTHGPKKDYDWRIMAQTRALEAGIDEVGHGVLYGLNEKLWGAEFETLAMIAHAQYLHQTYGKWSQSMSFPRVQHAPDINFEPRVEVTAERLARCVSVVKLTVPAIDTVITCREPAELRRRLRPIVNIEDFAARPGPGGNSLPEARQQMFLPDLRSGEEVRDEITREGYLVR